MIRVDYAGPGGVCEGMRSLGLVPVGIEWDAAACATRAAAGHLTIRADLATYRPHHRTGRLAGYWASPPCQTFSAAGKGAGRELIPALVAAIDAEDWAAADRFDPKTRHVIDAARCAVELGSEWVGMEQVPAVLPVFQAICRRLRSHGYSAWCGVLNSADYGVPQTRERAILMASRTVLAHPPAATHAKHPSVGLFAETLPWVTMADALGWPAWTTVDRRQVSAGAQGTKVPVALVGADRPAPTVTGLSGGQWIMRLRPGAQDRATVRRVDEPAPTIAFGHDFGSWCWEHPAPTVSGGGTAAGGGAEPFANTDARRRIGAKLAVPDALVLQSFPSDYPVQGTKGKQFEQVGNACPPLLAARVVGALARLPVGAP